MNLTKDNVQTRLTPGKALVLFSDLSPASGSHAQQTKHELAWRVIYLTLEAAQQEAEAWATINRWLDSHEVESGHLRLTGTVELGRVSLWRDTGAGTAIESRFDSGKKRIPRKDALAAAAAWCNAQLAK